MVAIDSAHDIPQSLPAETAHTGWIVLSALLISALVAAVALTMADDGTGWPQAADMVSRFSLLIFVALMVVEPLGRLVPSRFTRALSQERGSLILGFVAATVMSLLCVVAPWLLVGQSLGAPTIAYCVLTSVILAVLLFTGHPATERLLGAPAWRTVRGIATAYFWMVFALGCMSRLIGPHRTDDWHGIALLLLTGALILRFADAFALHRRHLAEKVA